MVGPTSILYKPKTSCTKEPRTVDAGVSPDAGTGGATPPARFGRPRILFYSQIY